MTAAKTSDPMPAITLLSCAMLLIGLDQASKLVVLSRARGTPAISFPLNAMRGLLNPRIKSSVARRGSLSIHWAMEVVFLVALVQFTPFFQNATAQVALGIALGGATSNLLDQLWRGGIVDFIDLGFWPVFNLADTAIIIGGLISVLYM